MIKTKVVIYFKNRVNKEEAFKFLNKILEHRAEIERLKVRVDFDC